MFNKLVLTVSALKGHDYGLNIELKGARELKTNISASNTSSITLP